MLEGWCMILTKNIVIRPLLREKFQKFLQGQRILFFGAPCGFGKTTVAEGLLSGRAVLRRSGEDETPIPEGGDWDILLVDDFQRMSEKAVQTLCGRIRRSPERRFVFLSRGAPPGCMMAFQYAGIMSVISPGELLLDEEDIQTLFRMQKLPVTRSEIAGILKASIGYPLGVAITIRLMAEGMPFEPKLVSEAFREVYRYFEAAIFMPLDLTIRRFLLELAPFETINLELAKMVSGDVRAGQMLDWIQKNSSMLQENGDELYFWPQYRDFLRWEMEKTFPDSKVKALLSRGGLYYELKEDYSRAMECYSAAGDHGKVSEILVRNAELHPGMGHYSEMEKYYRSLPESEILESPALMQGMCMLCALAVDYPGSDRWYEALRRFSQERDPQDAAAWQARSRLAWLDVSLPQRGVEGLTQTIPAVVRLMTDKEVSLPPFSVTSALPTIMNGGKDFSPWSKKDDLLYSTIRVPVEKLLRADGVGLPDCALAESKFEKGEDISQRLLTVVSRMREIQQSGTPDIEFAACGLLVRNYIDQGRLENARRTLELQRKQFVERGQLRFLPNLDAMSCRVDLHGGDLDRADIWYREKAPRDPVHLNILKRYQYLTQAMVELADDDPEGALLTLAPLESYCAACGRYIDSIHLNVLSALALYRLRDGRWKERMRRALDTAGQFRFIRTISVYGGAVLPLLTQLEGKGDEAFRKRLLIQTRKQAAATPLFLQPRLSPGEELTTAEKQILRLICADKSNAEIAQTMNIKLTTVKTHVSHILEKLDVNRRSEAKTAAIRLRLIPEDS